MAPRYLLQSPTGQFFQHSPAAAVPAWTESPATAHQWVDFDRAFEAVKRWHQHHGETLAVVTANSLPTLRVGVVPLC